MMYCMNCGGKNDNSTKKCKNCGLDMSSKAQKIQLTADVKTIYKDYNEVELIDPEFSGTKLSDVEPATEEEISKFKVANANKSINLRDMMKEAAKKDKDKKQSKPPKTRKPKK